MEKNFNNPEFLWLLLLLVPMVVLYILRVRRGGATLTISDTSTARRLPRTARYYLRHLPFVMRAVAVALLIVALARPQSSEQGSLTSTQGIDIVLAMDISGSMLARDFEPDRITAAREVAANFIVDRPNDRIGLVVFAGESYTQSPLTTDKSSLLTLLGQVQSGVIDDGTAIGNGLATAVNRLKDSEAKSKVAILLTDGVNNSGQIAPLTAAEIAKGYGIKVYTIGVGTRGLAPYPVYDMWGRLHFQQMEVDIDEQVLTDIADLTGGKYFRATDRKTLAEIYNEINSLEKTKIETDEFVKYTELYRSWLLAALLLLVGEVLVRKLLLKQIP